MQDRRLFRLAAKIRPALREQHDLAAIGGTLDVLAILYVTPLAVLSLVWLIRATDVALLRREWLLLAGLLLLYLLFSRYRFQMRMELRRGGFAYADGSLENMVDWSAALLLGPIALWVPILAESGRFVYQIRREGESNLRWLLVRTLLTAVGVNGLGVLSGLWAYRQLGGAFPFPSLTWESVGVALVATLVAILVPTLIMLPYLLYLTRLPELYGDRPSGGPGELMRFFLTSAGLSSLALPFSILAAGLYTQYGLGIYLFFLVGAFMASLLANRLSRALQRSQQRSRELHVLEQLGREIIATEADVEGLPALLEDRLPAMLPRSRIVIWLWPDRTLYDSGRGPALALDEMQQALQAADAPDYIYRRDVRLPVERKGVIGRNVLALPVVGENGRSLGGIYVQQRQDVGAVIDYLPATQSLAAQIASALHRAEMLQQTIANERMARELEVAGRIQSSFLPVDVPQMPGWEITAALEPARQTSGDFYDFVRMDDGRLGIIVADVADKGTGAALFMALSRTLLRTYALAHPDAPEQVLRATNERILADTRTDQFVTVFYGVLDAEAGTLLYANAGHNPAYLLCEGSPPQALSHTGIPLGMFEEMAWKCNAVTVAPGDLLVMYTDGVTETQDADGAEFGEERMLNVLAQWQNGRSLADTQQDLLAAIHTFAGDAPQFDDITLMLVRRLPDRVHRRA